MSRGSVLQQIKPFHPELKPPPGAEPFGRTADGKHQLYRLVSRRSRGVPLLEKGPQVEARRAALVEEGKPQEEIDRILTEEFRVFRKNQQTGENAYPLNRPELYKKEEVFYLVSDGHGNVYKEYYRPPTEEELKAQKRREQVEAMKDKVAEVLVDRGVDPERLVDLVRAPQPVPAAAVNTAAPAPSSPEPEQPKAVSPYPISMGGGYWLFSDGTKEQMKKDAAVAYEAALPEDVRAAAALAHQHAEEAPAI